MIKPFLAGCLGASGLMLSIQLYLSATLNGGGVEPAALSELTLRMYMAAYQPLKVCFTVSLTSLVVLFAWAIASGEHVGRRSGWLAPLLVSGCYLLSLTFFVSGDQIYMDPDFRSQDYAMDPLKLFVIPFMFGMIFLALLATVLLGVVFLLGPRKT